MESVIVRSKAQNHRLTKEQLVSWMLYLILQIKQDESSLTISHLWNHQWNEYNLKRERRKGYTVNELACSISHQTPNVQPTRRLYNSQVSTSYDIEVFFYVDHDLWPPDLQISPLLLSISMISSYRLSLLYLYGLIKLYS